MMRELSEIIKMPHGYIHDLQGDVVAIVDAAEIL